MAINPELITTIRVDQLPDEALSLTNLFPHTVGTDLKSATIQELVDLVATAIGAGSGVGFLPISVTNGQQLPDVPENPSFFLCGAGTFLNINGYPDVICTGELNAVMSLSDHWEVAVEIPIVAEVGVQTVTGSAVDNTDPLNPVINSTGGSQDLQQVTDEGNETTNGMISYNGFYFQGPTGNYVSMFDDGLYINTNGTIFQHVRLRSDSMTGIRTVQFQDADGTVALLSDITSGAVDSVNGQTGVVVLDADDIDDTSTTNKFTTAADISKLAGIEANADVTDSANVNAAGAVMNSDYSSHSILVQQSGSGSPTSLGIANNTLVGRLSGGGSNINDLSVSDVKGLLDFTTPTDVQTIANAKVTDAIVDGVTTVAPSQNAVFDALAIKSDIASPTFTGVVTTPEIVLTSTTKGFTPNALTTTQRNAISSPTAGLMIFNTTEGYPEYFDSFWGWMPLYTSNEWKAKNGIEYFNELSTPLSGDGMLTSGTAAASITFASSGISNRMGIAILSTSTSATGRAWIGQGVSTTATIMRMGGGRIILETSVRIPTLSDGTQRFQFLSGLSSTNNGTSISNGILFAYDEGGVSAGSSASANWQVATMSGGTRTWTTTSVPVVAGQFYRLTIEINDACTSVVFKIDGTTVRTETLTLPSSTDIGLMTQIYKSIGTTARTVEVDYISFKQKFTTAR